MNDPIAELEREFTPTELEDWYVKFDETLDTVRDYFNRDDLNKYFEELIRMLKASRCDIQTSVIFEVNAILRENPDLESVGLELISIYEGLRARYARLYWELFLGCSECGDLFDGIKVAINVELSLQDGSAWLSPETKIVQPIMDDFDSALKHVLAHAGMYL